MQGDTDSDSSNINDGASGGGGDAMRYLIHHSVIEQYRFFLLPLPSPSCLYQPVHYTVNPVYHQSPAACHQASCPISHSAHHCFHLANHPYTCAHRRTTAKKPNGKLQNRTRCTASLHPLLTQCMSVICCSCSCVVCSSVIH